MLPRTAVLSSLKAAEDALAEDQQEEKQRGEQDQEELQASS
jgi:hypothetical protein